MTEQEATKYKRVLKKATQDIASDKKKAQEYLQKLGVVTATGKLTTHYK